MQTVNVISSMSMPIMIAKLKITNFLSFVGEQEVSCRDLTVLASGNTIGTTHFVKALKYVFGSNLADLGCKTNSDLFPANMSGDFERRSLVVSADVTIDSRAVQITRSIRNGIEVFHINNETCDISCYISFISKFKPLFISPSDIYTIFSCEYGLHNIVATLLGSNVKVESILKERNYLQTDIKESNLLVKEIGKIIETIGSALDECKLNDQYQQVANRRKANLLQKIANGRPILEDERRPEQQLQEFDNGTEAPEGVADIFPKIQELTKKIEECKLKDGAAKAAIFVDELTKAKTGCEAVNFRKLERKLENAITFYNQDGGTSYKNERYSELEKVNDEIRELTYIMVDHRKSQFKSKFEKLSDRIFCGQFDSTIRAALGTFFDAYLVPTDLEATELLNQMKIYEMEGTILVLDKLDSKFVEYLFRSSDKIRLTTERQQREFLEKCFFYGLIEVYTHILDYSSFCEKRHTLDGNIIIPERKQIYTNAIFSRYEFKPDKSNLFDNFTARSLVNKRDAKNSIFVDLKEKIMQDVEYSKTLSFHLTCQDLLTMEKLNQNSSRLAALKKLNKKFQISGAGIPIETDCAFGDYPVQSLPSDELKKLEKLVDELFDEIKDLEECKTKEENLLRKFYDFPYGGVKQTYIMCQNTADIEKSDQNIFSSVKKMLSKVDRDLVEISKSVVALTLNSAYSTDLLEMHINAKKTKLEDMLKQNSDSFIEFINKCNQFFNRRFVKFAELTKMETPALHIKNDLLTLTCAKTPIYNEYRCRAFIVIVVMLQQLAEYFSKSTLVLEELDGFLPETDQTISLIFKDGLPENTVEGFVKEISQFFVEILKSGSGENTGCRQFIISSNNALVGSNSSSFVFISTEEKTVDAKNIISSNMFNV